MYLLDTNIVSEIVKRIPNAAVMASIRAHRSQRLFASELTRFELRLGACLRGDAESFWARLQAEVMPAVDWLQVTKPITESAGEIAANLQKRGREAKDPIDPLLAATAVVHGFVLVTRNVRDFEHIPGLRLENWFA